jgi:hypothetical protein
MLMERQWNPLTYIRNSPFGKGVRKATAVGVTAAKVGGLLGAGAAAGYGAHDIQHKFVQPHLTPEKQTVMQVKTAPVSKAAETLKSAGVYVPGIHGGEPAKHFYHAPETEVKNTIAKKVVEPVPVAKPTPVVKQSVEPEPPKPEVKTEPSSLDKAVSGKGGIVPAPGSENDIPKEKPKAGPPTEKEKKKQDWMDQMSKMDTSFATGDKERGGQEEVKFKGGRTAAEIEKAESGEKNDTADKAATELKNEAELEKAKKEAEEDPSKLINTASASTPNKADIDKKDISKKVDTKKKSSNTEVKIETPKPAKKSFLEVPGKVKPVLQVQGKVKPSVDTALKHANIDKTAANKEESNTLARLTGGADKKIKSTPTQSAARPKTGAGEVAGQVLKQNATSEEKKLTNTITAAGEKGIKKAEGKKAADEVLNKVNAAEETKKLTNTAMEAGEKGIKKAEGKKAADEVLSKMDAEKEQKAFIDRITPSQKAQAKAIKAQSGGKPPIKGTALYAKATTLASAIGVTIAEFFKWLFG